MAATFAGLLFGYLLAGVYIGIPQILLVLLAVSMGITVLYIGVNLPIFTELKSF